MEYLDDVLRVILVVVSLLAVRLFWNLSHLFKKDAFEQIYRILAYGFLAFAAGHALQLAFDLANVSADGLDFDLPVEIVFIGVLLYGLYSIRHIGDDA